MGSTIVVATLLPFVLFLLLSIGTNAEDDDYALSDPSHKSFMVALGCFWCAEQAFEQYAPGVIEVVSGYAGGLNENPTYRNHPGHYEVILIEYDPSKTTFELLTQYAWRNLDPFDGIGQFCDKGTSYRPAIFYGAEDERIIVDSVKSEILEMNPEWDASDIVVPNLQRPKFWTAEDYHQNYYIKNPKNYGFYKNACGRTKRLKEVWGEEEYMCYHDLESSCFNITVINDEGEEVAAVLNEDGEKVASQINVKNAPEETIGLLPTWAVIVVSIAGAIVGCALLVFIKVRCCSDKKEIQ